MAVSGGVRYIKLDTRVAAFFLISANNRKMAPIDKAKTDQHSAPIKSADHCTESKPGVRFSKIIAKGKVISADAVN